MAESYAETAALVDQMNGDFAERDARLDGTPFAASADFRRSHFTTCPDASEWRKRDD
jgi:hypothetical protein